PPLLKQPVYGQNQAPSANVAGANDRIVVGFIGVGAQGLNAHVRQIKTHATENNVALAAVCDIWPKRVDAAKELIGGDCQGYDHYQKLLERKDITGVVIATHDPMHATIAIDAPKPGKHASREKHMTPDLREALHADQPVKK